MRTRTYRAKARTQRSRMNRAFPYHRVAKLWERGKTIAQIAHAIDRVDKDNPKDPYHSLRNFLYRMHKGYLDAEGRIVCLPYRVSKQTVTACAEAGSRAW